MQLSIRLKEPIVERLNALSKKTGHSKTFYITEAINEHLAELETVYLAEQRLADIENGKVKTIPWEEVQRKNGLL
jgi:RHH-type rel operon transcriptional repressor/antitoxin RelB